MKPNLQSTFQRTRFREVSCLPSAGKAILSTSEMEKSKLLLTFLNSVWNCIEEACVCSLQIAFDLKWNNDIKMCLLTDGFNSHRT